MHSLLQNWCINAVDECYFGLRLRTSHQYLMQLWISFHDFSRRRSKDNFFAIHVIHDKTDLYLTIQVICIAQFRNSFGAMLRLANANLHWFSCLQRGKWTLCTDRMTIIKNHKLFYAKKLRILLAHERQRIKSSSHTPWHFQPYLRRSSFLS